MNGLEAVVAVAKEALSGEVAHRDPESPGREGVCVNCMNMSDPRIFESVDGTPSFQLRVDSPKPNRDPTRIHEILAEIDIPIGILGEGAIHQTIAFDLEERDGRAHRVRLEAQDLSASDPKDTSAAGGPEVAFVEAKQSAGEAADAHQVVGEVLGKTSKGFPVLTLFSAPKDRTTACRPPTAGSCGMDDGEVRAGSENL